MDKTKKILIVDDDLDVINIIETILTNEGYQVVTANNKIEALRVLETEKPDLAIVDVMMTTEFEGFELVKQMKSTPETINIPVLIQTSMYVIETTENDIVKLVHEYRKSLSDKQLNAILVQNTETGESGIDYLDETGKTNWVPVDGFIKKPVESKKLLPAIEKVVAVA